MQTVTRTMVLAGAIIVAAAITAGAVVWSGVYNVAADSPHSRPVYALLEMARDRSIGKRAGPLQVPAGLGTAEQVRQGAGNYHAMCAACHLVPGATGTELSRGLYPAPPDLTSNAVDPTTAFWVIKHGIKASGMPAWGRSMDDEYIWNMVAFVQKLPGMDATSYRQLVASSAGHSHGGGETDLHGAAGNTGQHDDHGHDGGAHRDMPDSAPPAAHDHPDADGAPGQPPPSAHAQLPGAATTPVPAHADHHDDHDHRH